MKWLLTNLMYWLLTNLTHCLLLMLSTLHWSKSLNIAIDPSVAGWISRINGLQRRSHPATWPFGPQPLCNSCASSYPSHNAWSVFQCLPLSLVVWLSVSLSLSVSLCLFCSLSHSLSFSPSLPPSLWGSLSPNVFHADFLYFLFLSLSPSSMRTVGAGIGPSKVAQGMFKFSEFKPRWVTHE